MRKLRNIIFAVVFALALTPALTLPAHAGIMEADIYAQPTPTPPPDASTSSTTSSTGSTDNSSGAALIETVLIILQGLVPRV